MRNFLLRYALLVALLVATFALPPAIAAMWPSVSGTTAPGIVIEDGAGHAVIPGGPPPPASGLANQASADSVSNLVFTATNKQLASLTVKIGTTSGYVMLIDAAALPANGVVTPKWCYPVFSNGTNGSVSAEWHVPLLFTTGVTVGFSTTGCDTLTASATAKFMGQAN